MVLFIFGAKFHNLSQNRLQYGQICPKQPSNRFDSDAESSVVVEPIQFNCSKMLSNGLSPYSNNGFLK